jgi:hypothetical protein
VVIVNKITLFIHQWLYKPFLGPGLFFSFIIFFTQTVGLLERVISPSQDRYLYTGQHKHRINAHTDIHTLSGIRTHDPSVRRSENSSCLRPRSHCARHTAFKLPYLYYEYSITKLCRQRTEIIQNHEKEYVHIIRQGEAKHRKYKGLKLGGGQTYDRSNY